MRILIVEKREIFRHGLTKILENLPEVKAILACSKGLEAIEKSQHFRPDIIHSHDWQTGLLPVYLKTIYKLDAFYYATQSVFTIHNLAYQGIFPVEHFTLTGLDWKYFNINGMEYYGHLNLMKGGIVFSDITTTVSDTYAREIQTPEYGKVKQMV